VTDRSGCGLAELTIVQAVAALSTGSDEAASARVLDEVDRRIGLGPSYAYPMVCDLTKPWVIPAPLLAISGNAGDRTFPQPAEPVHTECRLSRVGEVVVAAEAGTIAPVPAGLINGTWWRGAAQPPLDPFGVITAFGTDIWLEALTAARANLLTGAQFRSELTNLMPWRLER